MRKRAEHCDGLLRKMGKYDNSNNISKKCRDGRNDGKICETR